jgi:hypothetical protein
MTASDRALGEGAEGFIGHERMRELHAQGLAVPLSRFITDHVRYQERWWIAERGGWHLVADGELDDLLNKQSTWSTATYTLEDGRNQE